MYKISRASANNIYMINKIGNNVGKGLYIFCFGIALLNLCK